MVVNKQLRSGTIRLEGAVDMHVHYGPEPLTDLSTGAHHSIDPLQATEQAEDAGFAGIVLKPHEFPSTALAALAESRAQELRVFAGIACDFPVGGLNPEAVEVALRAGAKMVWLPTFSSRSTAEARMLKMWGHTNGISVLDDDGQLTEPVRQIMDLVVEHDALLASGHITHPEQFVVAEAFGGTGCLVVTHAMQSTDNGGVGPGLSVEQCVELARLGATLEFSARMCMGTPIGEDQVAKAIARIGTEHVVLSSDLGWSQELPNPAPGLRGYIDRLWELGVEEAELKVMVADNPSRLLRM